MTTTIGNGTTTLTPEVVTGFRAKFENRNVVHQIIDGPDDVSLVPPGPRTGRAVAVFSSREDAWALAAMFAAPAVYTYTDSLAPDLDMSFVLDDDTELELSRSRSSWRVSFGFRQVTP